MPNGLFSLKTNKKFPLKPYGAAKESRIQILNFFEGGGFGKKKDFKWLAGKFFFCFAPASMKQNRQLGVCGRFYDAEETQLFYVPQMSDSFSVLAKPRRFFNSLARGSKGVYVQLHKLRCFPFFFAFRLMHAFFIFQFQILNRRQSVDKVGFCCSLPNTVNIQQRKEISSQTSFQPNNKPWSK